MISLENTIKFKLSVFIWLIILTIMVLAIIIVGGLTRLTDSGLSMVDWRPILGIIPPLSKKDWINVFVLYCPKNNMKFFKRFFFDFSYNTSNSIFIMSYITYNCWMFREYLPSSQYTCIMNNIIQNFAF